MYHSGAPPEPVDRRQFFVRRPHLKRWELSWRLGCSEMRDELPREWVPARVPGGAQLDWGRAHGWRDHHYADGWRQYSGLEDLFWTYRTHVRRADLELDQGQRVHFVCEGVDYECDVIINGKLVHHQAGLHVPIDVDITNAFHAEPIIEIRVYPAPKADTECVWGEEWARSKRSQARSTTKPSVSYGDDFHPRLIPLGIWQNAYLEIRPEAHFTRVQVAYRLSEDLSSASIWIDGELNIPARDGVLLQWLIRTASGEPLATLSGAPAGRQFAIRGSLRNPELWWPHDHGNPHLYASDLEMIDAEGRLLDAQRLTFGVRRLRLVMHEGAWDTPDPVRWPKTRSNPPITIEVNGRQIFGRGACCVPMNIFFGTVTSLDCDELVRTAKAANFNLLRISGGCVAFKPEFYDACDRHGLLLWQDFPLACNQYPDDDEYLELLDSESRAMIGRLRGHPSLALWCGGNELFEVHSGMTDQSLALRLLNKNTFELDRDRPFISSTPDMGIAHGPYEFANQVDGKIVEGSALIQNSHHTAYPEFGCPAPASVEVLKTFIPPEELFPPLPRSAWEDHKGFFAFVEREETWLNLPLIEYYFGTTKSLEELVERGQQLQGQSLKAIYEEARRQQPTCSMAVMWSFNEPWPNAANLSLLSWPRVAKAGYADVAAACRPVLASARVRKFVWQPGERFDVELWLLSDSPHPTEGDTLEVHIGKPNGPTRRIGEWSFDALRAQENRRGPTVEVELPDYDSNDFVLSLRCEGQPEIDSEYRFCLLGPNKRNVDSSQTPVEG